MRADIVTTVSEINKSLALLRQRLNWDTVSHRLEEFNARVEDPDLWNNPDSAQKLMRERQTLVDAVAVHDSIAQDLNDNVEMIELGEMEDDQEVISDAQSALNELAKKAALKAAIGPRCWRGCICDGLKKLVIKSKCNPKRPGKRLALNR